MMISLKPTNTLLDQESDCIIFISDNFDKQPEEFNPICNAIKQYAEINKQTSTGTHIIFLPDYSKKRLIFSSTGPLNRDFDDSRNVYDAATNGIKTALNCGSKCPLLILGHLSTAPKDEIWTQGFNPLMTAILGAYLALYTPFEIREDCPDRVNKANCLLVYNCTDSVKQFVSALESGRCVARDIGGSDPERMAAPKVADYIRSQFKDSDCVKVTIGKVDGEKYPLMEAVNRCASVVERHDGRVVHFEFDGGNADTTLFFVGKGITYDTGGADIKAGGVMAGMHRDKCGAAAVTGFFKILSLLKPKGLRVYGACAYVRNSVGSNSYVADEIITSRAKKRIRIGNTDAEGRMVMADLLCEAKEKAVDAINPHIFTVATLTGHVIRAWGPAYTAVMDNGLAKKKKMAYSLQEAGEKFAEPVEVSSIRREDYDSHRGKSEYDDILQANNLPSTQTARGHMTPSAFLIMASGLDAHGLDSDKPLAYTHIDCAGSSGPYPGIPTGAPISALVTRFVLPRLNL